MKGIRFGGTIVAIGVAAIVVSLLAASFGKTEKYDPYLFASWVQAVGSVLAIVGTVWAVQFQSASALRDRKEAILGVADAVQTWSKKIREMLSETRPRSTLQTKFHDSVLKGLIGALGSIPIQDVGRGEAVVAFLDLRNQLAFLSKAIEEYAPSPWVDQEFVKTYEQMKDSGATREQLAELLEIHESVLLGNIASQLDAVDRHLKRLSKAMGRQHTHAKEPIE